MDSARLTLWLILLPMIATVAGIRSYHHLIHVRHIYLAGYLLRHLFLGVCLVIPAAFILAFRPNQSWVWVLAPIALGVGTAMVLDEVVFLVFTNATDEDYVSPISLGGSIAAVSIAVILLLVLYKLMRA
jgi:hypothetical protein